MADAAVTPGRHRRQRSSVTIKKRVSRTPLQDKESDSYEVPDNALSPRAQTTTGQALAGDTFECATAGRAEDPENSLLFQSTEVQASNSKGLNASALEVEEVRQDAASMDAEAGAAQAASSAEQSDGHDHNRNMSGQSEGYQLQDATTRAEPDLFGDEDSASDVSSFSTTMTSSAPSNPVFPTEQAPTHVASPSSATTPKMSSLGFVDTGNTPGARSGAAQVRAPLLINTVRSNGEASSSPRTSPRALRMQPSSSQTASGTPRSARKIKRMSLGYFANADTAIDSPTTSASGFPMTPPMTAVSGSMTSTRAAMHSAARSASVSTTASTESAAKSSTLLEGETLLTQDKDTLARIAEKERGILELRETLAREERELAVLKREWQRSAQRKIAHIAPVNLEKGSRTGNMSASSQDKADTVSITSAQTPAAGTTDALRGISARLQSNFGTQINAFLDQLVPISPQLDQDKALSDDATRERNTPSQTLTALPEEEEYDATSRTPVSQAAPNVAHGSRLGQKQGENDASQQAKRGSVFATSFAAFQKQMEKQLNTSLGGGEAPDQAEAGNETGWSSWQKRLKDARDNASDFLAKAEARIGQVMTLDDLIKLEGPDQEACKATMSRSDSTNAFEEENDREKAALAELSWMNSLAGLKTSGTVDRVVTSAASPRIGDSSSHHQAERSVSNESSRPLETTNLHSAVRATGSVPVGANRGNGKSRRSSESRNEAAKGGSGGFFDTLSTVWATAVDISPPTTSKPLSPVTNRDRRLSGQNKTRSAAQSAVKSRPEKNGDGVQMDGSSAPTTAKTVQKKQQAPSPETQAKADNDWSW